MVIKIPTALMSNERREDNYRRQNGERPLTVRQQRQIRRMANRLKK